MIDFRIARCAIASAGGLLPLGTLWGLMLWYAAAPSKSPIFQSGIPVPKKAVPSTMTPADVLVYADPWFAGTVQLWMFICCGAGTVLVLAALCLPVRHRSGRSLAAWGLASLLVGSVFAAPWAYGLFLLIARDGT